MSSLRPAVEPAGTALAIVELVECRPMARTDEPAAMAVREADAVAWVLENARAVEPMAVTGRPRLYTVDIGDPARKPLAPAGRIALSR